jgi:hypothetical protein
MNYEERSQVKRTLLIATIASVVGMGIGFVITGDALGAGYDYFYLYAGSAAFMTSAFFWWWLLERNKGFKIINALLAGLLSGSLSHYVCWYLLFIALNYQHWFFKNGYSSLGEPPANLIEAIVGAAVLSVWSLVLFGWITVVAAMVIFSGACFIINHRLNNRN